MLVKVESCRKRVLLRAVRSVCATSKDPTMTTCTIGGVERGGSMLGKALLGAFMLLITGSYTIKVSKLAVALSQANASLHDIENQWKVNSYPLFMQSCHMTRSGWELLKWKFISRVLLAMSEGPQNFTVSFMGSGVTAGYDNIRMDLFTTLVEAYMRPALSKLNVRFNSRNVGIASNPSVPYAMCSRTFVGNDADLVYWEYTNDCGYPECEVIMEQFIRQTLLIPSTPVIALAHSFTPFWRRSDCEGINISDTETLDEIDMEYITTHGRSDGIMRIATEINRNNWQQTGHFHNIIAHYKAIAGFQMWDHSAVDKYKCRGPYVPQWSDFSAKWHPSVRGHQLRAAQYAYFWLAVWRDAVLHIQNKLQSSHRLIRNSADLTNKLHDDAIVQLLGDTTFNIKHYNSKYPMGKALFPTNISDGVKCFTEFEPRALRNYSISNLVLSGQPPQYHEMIINGSYADWIVARDHAGWRKMVLDTTEVIMMHFPTGLLDYKCVLCANKDSGPLSIQISVSQQPGHIFLCEAPGVWKKLSDELTHIWESDLGVYLTPNPRTGYFSFEQDKATELHYFYHDQDTCYRKKLCVQIEEVVNQGDYVLTLLPRSSQTIALATILTP